MLILTRKPSEVIFIGDDIKVTLVEIKGNQVRLGIDAPAHYRIFRKEIYDQIQEENRVAAAGVDLSTGLEGLSAQWSDDAGKKKTELGDKSVARAVLPAFTTAKVSSSNPQVLIKRKKDRKLDE